MNVAQSCLTLYELVNHTVHGILQARLLQWVATPFSRGSSQPRSPALQADSLPVEPQGKPKNTGLGSLSLLQWIFPTQELNQGLLHCRQILYQLSYEGSPIIKEMKRQLTEWEKIFANHISEKEIATHSSILAWRIPWTEEPGGATVHRVAKSWTRFCN